MEKIDLIPMGKDDNAEELADVLGCKVGSLPSIYLSMSLGTHYNSSTMWDGVEECFRKRLAMWK